jgi:nicotinamide-nucleotide amidase
MMTTIALLNIGTELLRGRTLNTNAATIGQMLRRHGFLLETTLVIHDTGPTITDAVERLMATHDAVLVTGGLGPTTDDITKKILLQVFGGEMVCHAPTLARIEGFLRARNMPLREHNRQQSFVPSSCEVLENEQGTAPGMWFERAGHVLVSMPGVPYEMAHLMEAQVLPRLVARFAPQHFVTRIVRTFGFAESAIAELMEAHAAEMDPRAEVAYLPAFDGVKIEIKMAGRPEDSAALEDAAAQMQARVAALMGKYLYATVDAGPAELLGDYLLATGLTFATAESCTGGAIAARLVERSGISSVLRGGVVAYQRQVKEQVLGVAPELIDTHGIVSAAVAEAMAQGVRDLLNADFAVAITGIAEAAPGASEAERPQAWLGFADAQGTRSHHIKLFKDRQVNLQMATQAALVFALRNLPPRD